MSGQVVLPSGSFLDNQEENALRFQHREMQYSSAMVPFHTPSHIYNDFMWTNWFHDIQCSWVDRHVQTLRVAFVLYLVGTYFRHLSDGQNNCVLALAL